MHSYHMAVCLQVVYAMVREEKGHCVQEIIINHKAPRPAPYAPLPFWY